MTGLIQNEHEHEQKNATSKQFTKKPQKTAEYTRTTNGAIFSADVYISGGQVIFHYKTWCITFQSFLKIKVLRDLSEAKV